MDITHHQLYCFACTDYVYDVDVDRIINREKNSARVHDMQSFGMRTLAILLPIIDSCYVSLYTYDGRP